MRMISEREARKRLASLLDAVAAGEEIVIVRNGKAVARLTAVCTGTVIFPDRSGLRDSLPPCAEKATRALRDQERY